MEEEFDKAPIFITAALALGILSIFIYGSYKHNECIYHTTYTEQACRKCIKDSPNGKYCIEYIDTICNIATYEEGYESCKNW